MKHTLAGKWVLITGASSGFGEAAARTFAAEGCRLLLGARRVDRLAKVARECQSQGAPEAHFHALDVARTDSVTDFFSWLAARADRLDCLLNNAGGAQGLDHVADAKDADWETMFQANVLGLLRVTRAALPSLRKAPGASIINIGSYAGHLAYEGGAAYCAAKAGVSQITRALRLELCGTGIRVTSLDPGMAETEFSVVRFKGDRERARKVYEGTQPLTAQDIAEMIVWIAGRPAHVNIDEMLVKPTDQAASYKVFRRKE